MFARIRRALLWVHALSRAREGDFSSSLTMMDSMHALHPLRPFEQAFRATLLLRQKNFEEADKEFERIALSLKEKKDPDETYTRLYCENTLAALDGDLDRERDTRERALSVTCSKLISNALPLDA